MRWASVFVCRFENHFKYWLNICNNMPQNPCSNKYPKQQYINFSIAHTSLLYATEFDYFRVQTYVIRLE